MTQLTSHAFIVLLFTLLFTTAVLGVAPNPPTNLHVVGRTANSLKVGWDAPSASTVSVASYVVTYTAALTPPVVNNLKTVFSSAILTSLINFQDYTVQVQACSDAAGTDCSTTGPSINTNTNVPSQPTSVSAYSDTSMVTVCWNPPTLMPPSTTIYYYLEWVDSSAIASFQPGRQCFTVNNLVSNSGYYFDLSACASAGSTLDCSIPVVLKVFTENYWYFGWYLFGPLIAAATLLLFVAVCCFGTHYRKSVRSVDTKTSSFTAANDTVMPVPMGVIVNNPNDNMDEGIVVSVPLRKPPLRRTEPIMLQTVVIDNPSPTLSSNVTYSENR